MIIAAGRVLARSGDLLPGHVVVAEGRIAEVAQGLRHDADHTFPDGTLIPGLIDLQVNGGVGIDLLAASAGDIGRLSVFLASKGVTGFLPTVITAPAGAMERAVAAIRQARPAGAEVLGIHIEGPLLNPERKGAHDPRYLRPGADPAVRDLYASALPDLRLVTLAPELPGAADLIAWLVEHGVIVSIGHSNATYGEAAGAFQAGARMVTHLFNGMRGLHHREPGVVGAAFDDPQCVCGLIADGVHVHPAAVRLAYRLLGADRVALVSDTVAAAGMPPGEYRLGGRTIRVVEGDAPRLPDGSLAGAVLSLDAAVENVTRWGISRREAAHSASAVPARVLGLADQGHIVPGARADLCVLGKDGRATLTVVGGQVAFRDGQTAG